MPVAIADNEVARRDHHALDRDRHVDLAGAVLVRPAMGDAGGENREIAGMERVVVADRAIDDDAAEAAGFGMRNHHLADQGIGEIAAAIHHDDVAGFGDIERLVHHKIVTGPGLDGEGGAGQHAAAMHRPQRCAARGHP